jgi:hypothetical protein
MTRERELLGGKGVAELRGCSKAHVSNLLEGKVSAVPPIPHTSAGRTKIIRRQAVMLWLEKSEQGFGAKL